MLVALLWAKRDLSGQKPSPRSFSGNVLARYGTYLFGTYLTAVSVAGGSVTPLSSTLHGPCHSWTVLDVPLDVPQKGTWSVRVPARDI